MSDLTAAIRWAGVLAACFAAGWPLARLLRRNSGFPAATLALPLGLLAGIFPLWFVAAGFGGAYSTVGLWVSLGVVGIAGWVALFRFQGRGAVDPDGVSGMAIAFTLIAVAFAAGVWLRGFTPDLTGTEKPMDAAFLASSMRAVSMPPPDPWFAGEPINYYHLGYVIFGAIGRMSGVPAWVAFNLAVPTVFAMAICAAAGAGWTLVRPWRNRGWAVVASAFSAFLIVIAGNLYAPFRVLSDFAAVRDAWWWDSAGIGWHASRIVCDGPRNGFACSSPSVETINEFPFFSVLLGDLHPHLMALPFAIASLALAVGLALDGAGGSNRAWRIRLAAAGAVVGSLYAINSWDLPTYLAAAGLAVLTMQRERGKALVADITALGLSALLPWLPFWLTFDPPTNQGSMGPVGAIALHAGERTSIGEFVAIFGVSATLAAMAIWASWAATKAAFPKWALGGVIGLGLVSVAAQGPVLFIAGVAAAVGVLALSRLRRPEPVTLPAMLASLGFALVAAVEVFYLRDVFDSRLNTLFKIYYQVWVLFGLSGAAAVGLLLPAIGRRGVRLAAGAAVAVAAGALLVYPALASWQWARDMGNGSWQGLDGLAYAEEAYPDEAAAVRWLAANARPGDVLVEAAGCSYFPIGDLPTNRMSAYTGVPAIIGWAGHENQWRPGQPANRGQIGPRGADVARIYAEPGGLLTEQYGVTWLVRGRYETGEWSDQCATAGPYPDIARGGWPGDDWDLAFEQGEVAIFERR